MYLVELLRVERLAADSDNLVRLRVDLNARVEVQEHRRRLGRLTGHLAARVTLGNGRNVGSGRV